MADNVVVLGVGTGVFVIAVVWIAAFLFGMMLLRASGSAKLGVIPVFLLALTINLALVFFPRSPETAPPFEEVKVEEQARDVFTFVVRPFGFHKHQMFGVPRPIVDSLFIGRYVLLAVVSAVFLVVFFMLLPFHFLEPVYAKALRTQ